MSYSDFTLKKTKSEFGLSTVENLAVFSSAASIEISGHLAQTLKRNVALALSINTEKARSELIIINVLLEVKDLLMEQISLFSGIDFNVDKAKGLAGYCDYIIGGSPEQLYLEAPVIAIVEAKNENIVSGLGKCVAEMVAAKLYNEQEGTPLPCIYGAVTTGDEWKFLKLHEDVVYIDRDSYYISEVNKIVGILVAMARQKA